MQPITTTAPKTPMMIHMISNELYSLLSSSDVSGRTDSDEVAVERTMNSNRINEINAPKQREQAGPLNWHTEQGEAQDLADVLFGLLRMSQKLDPFLSRIMA